MLVAAAVCPHPPLLVPEAMGEAGLLDATAPPATSEDLVDAQIRELRAASCAAVTGFETARPDLIVVVGGGTATRVHPSSAAGSLSDLGIPFRTGSGEPVLPLSLTIGSWLIRRSLGDGRSGPRCRMALQEVAHSWTAPECLRLGTRLAAQAPRVALLAMGDGSARKAIGVPGAADPPAERYDALVAAALAAADTAALARLDPRLDGEFLVAGRAAWQVLAGAAGGRRFRGKLGYAAAPLDVSYLVASWLA